MVRAPEHPGIAFFKSFSSSRACPAPLSTQHADRKRN